MHYSVAFDQQTRYRFKRIIWGKSKIPFRPPPFFPIFGKNACIFVLDLCRAKRRLLFVKEIFISALVFDVTRERCAAQRRARVFRALSTIPAEKTEFGRSRLIITLKLRLIILPSMHVKHVFVFIPLHHCDFGNIRSFILIITIMI